MEKMIKATNKTFENTSNTVHHLNLTFLMKAH